MFKLFKYQIRDEGVVILVEPILTYNFIKYKNKINSKLKAYYVFFSDM